MDAREVAQSSAGDVHAFGCEQLPLDERIAVAAQPAAGGHDPVAGHAGAPTPAQDVADGAGRGRASRECGNVAVGGHPPARNAPDHREDALRESIPASGRRAGTGQCEGVFRHRSSSPPALSSLVAYAICPVWAA